MIWCMIYYMNVCSQFVDDVSGCEQCNCDKVGSVSPQCNDSGHCQCKEFTLGIHCDQCAHNHWGLPHQPCQGSCCSTSSDDSLSFVY